MYLKKSMKEILIVGAGGFGRELLQWIKDINRITPKWEIGGFLDDNLDALNDYEIDYPIVGTIQGYVPKENEVLACAIANPNIKERVIHVLKQRGAEFTSVIHPTALVSDYAKLGEGIIMYPNSGINANAKMGDFVTLLSSGIGHDAVIGDYSTISSYCDITGGVCLGERVFLGSHVTIVPQRRIGSDVYIGVGSVVMTNIKPGYHVMGNPAKKFDF